MKQAQRKQPVVSVDNAPGEVIILPPVQVRRTTSTVTRWLRELTQRLLPPLLLLALFDTLALAERVARLYGMDVTLPALTWHRLAPYNQDDGGLVAAYLHAAFVEEGEQPDGRRDRCSRPATIC